MNRLLLKESGFSLTELIVVIAIMGMLVSISLPKYVNIAQDAKHKQLLSAKGALATNAHTINVLYRSKGGNNSAKSGSYTLNNGTRVRMRYGYPRGSDLVNLTELNGFHVETKSNRADVRMDANDETFLRYNPKKSGLYLDIKGNIDNL